MTFLELCQDLMREAGISGSLASVEGQTGEAQRVVNWIAKAYRLIQNAHVDWNFLRANIGFDTAPTNGTYSAASAEVAGFGEWCWSSSWRSYRTTTGVIDEQPLRFMDYDAFRDTYDFGANRLVSGRPQIVAELPDQSLQLWPIPDASYTIVGQQYRAPLALTANTDVPIFAARFHDVIVQRALMLYGIYEGDATVHAAAQAECMRILGQMESFYLPDITIGEPMA